MKVLLISNMYPSKDEPVYGNFIREQVVELEKEQFSFDKSVITRRGGNAFQKISKYLKLWSKYSILGTLKKYDIIHIHTTFPTALFFPWVRLFSKAKVVVTLHETDSLRYTGYKRKFVKDLLQSSDRVIAVSDNLRDEIIDSYELDKDKVLSINCGVNREMFPPSYDKTSFKTKLGLNPNKKLILFLGRTYKEKGIYTYLEMMKKFEGREDVQFAVVGNGPETENVKEIGNKTNVEFTYHPSIPKEDVYQWFSAADVFTFPTEVEAFGLVALESVSCLTPVVASNVGGVPETVKHNETGFLIPVGDSDKLKEYIEELLANENLYKKMQENCNRIAEQNTIKQQLQKLKDCYLDLTE